MRASNLLWTARDHAYSPSDYYYSTVRTSPISSSSSSPLTNYQPRKIAPRRPIFPDEENEKQQNPVSTVSKASLNRDTFPATMGDRIVDHINQVATSLKATQLSSTTYHV